MKINYIQVAVLKSILGGSSKIYAGLYNGTPVQIYPSESGGDASLIKVLESNYNISINPGEIKGYSSKTGIQFNISSFTPGAYYIRFIPTSISGTIKADSSAAVSVTVNVGFTGSTSSGTAAFTAHSRTITVQNGDTYNMSNVNLLDEQSIYTANVVYSVSSNCRVLSYTSDRYYYEIKISLPVTQFISLDGAPASAYYTASIHISGKLIFYKLQF